MNVNMTVGLVAVLCLASLAAAGTVTMPSIFSENMVLQRGVPIPVWGTADANEELTVTLGEQKIKTVAKDGNWRVVFEPMPAGGPHTLAVLPKDIGNAILLTQVMVGEVWLICGQSNMLMPMEDAEGAAEAIAERTKYPNIRVVLAGKRDPSKCDKPQTVAEGYWGPLKWENTIYTLPRSSKKDVPGCSSAVSYFFARELYKHFDGNVPVGMVEVGAIMPAESWVDDDTVAATPEIASLRKKPYPNATSQCFNANIAPLAGFPVRGFIYYQGEMNGGRGKEYRATLPALISSWRKAWNDANLPFLIVQLPGFVTHKGPQDKRLDMDANSLAIYNKANADHGFCGVREAQLMTYQSVPRTGLAITIDVGDPYDIHPAKKLPVGQRLFLQARRLAYGEKDLVACGPTPRKIELRGGQYVVEFDNVGGGLVVKGDKLLGFEIKGEGGAFVEADARIEGATVVVSHKDVAKPIALRYAWAGMPPCTLYNKEGLPASPFRQPTE